MFIREQAMAVSDVGKEHTIKMLDDAQYLVDHLREVPVHVIPCIEGRVENVPMIVQIATWGSIFPAALTAIFRRVHFEEEES